jgi:RNA polymerase sigma-70 factor (ECF subfamily)
MADPDAFVALYERDAEAVLVFLTRRTLDVEVALDLTAETFAQAWRGWAGVRLDSPEEVRGWMFTIARRQLGHYFRRGHAERRALHRMAHGRARSLIVAGKNSRLSAASSTGSRVAGCS